MALSHARLVSSIIVATLVAAACTADAPSTPEVSPAASPSSPITVATARPTAAATPATPSLSATPTPTPTPTPTSEPTPVPVPPKPTGVTFDESAQMQDGEGGLFGEVTQTVTWQAPRSEGVEIRVYGVTECIAEPADPAPGTSGPCLVVHTPLPASVRTLLARAPASDGVVSWTWTQHQGDCGNPYPASGPDGIQYHSVVLAAYGASDHSIFAIAEPGGWWRPGLDEIVC